MASEYSPPSSSLSFLRLMGSRYEPLYEFSNGKATINPAALTDLQSSIDRLKPSLVVALQGGAEHFVHGAVRSPQPFDFILPHRPDLPLPDDVQIIPYDLLQADLLTQMRLRWTLIAAIRPFGDFRLCCVSPPPPVRDSSTVLRELPDAWRDNAAKLGIPEPWTRYRIWFAFKEAARQATIEAGALWIDAPSETIDPDGFLKEEFRRDGLHGNAAYGAAVLGQIRMETPT